MLTNKQYFIKTGDTRYNSKWLQRNKCDSFYLNHNKESICFGTYKIITSTQHLYYKYIKCMNTQDDQKETKGDKKSSLE